MLCRKKSLFSARVQVRGILSRELQDAALAAVALAHCAPTFFHYTGTLA